ncbi:THBS2S [Mytilus coruscus]|uniref:THBS2S n=1 Tax=Mytilus coruscus TaxID=42192 RepID=A0A6J8B5Q9_MYTCO|nr:THBS2S [Mytilus coruscus]
MVCDLQVTTTLIRDFCDTDIDGDGVLNDEDNCVFISNPSQTDSDGNHRGDVCESDYDQDGTIDTLDNCPNNKFINESDFGTYTGLDLNPELTLQPAPSWMILHGGKEIRQVSVTTKPVASVGNHRGDVCESDYDQDGTIDTLDNCPNNKFINESDFGYLYWFRPKS